MTYDFIMGIAELLAHELVLPFFGLVAAGRGGYGIDKRHIEELVLAEGTGLQSYKGLVFEG
jgi:hypothetical protein